MIVSCPKRWGTIYSFNYIILFRNNSIVAVVAIVLLGVGFVAYKNKSEQPVDDNSNTAPTVLEEKPSVPEEKPEEPEKEPVPPVEEKPKNPAVGGITPGVDPLNTTYLIDNELVTLVNGVYEKDIPNSSAKIRINVFSTVKGDLNNDNVEDSALMLTKTSGGSGTFYYTAAVITQPDNTVLGTNAELIGDRISPQTTNILDGEIIVNYAVSKLDENGKEVSVGQTKYFRVEDKNHLVEKESGGD